ncbi:MAG: hypothetical protein WC371_05745 [Parachlamydiales bacterium]|jgi:hypothetical protein
MNINFSRLFGFLHETKEIITISDYSKQAFEELDLSNLLTFKDKSVNLVITLVKDKMIFLQGLLKLKQTDTIRQINLELGHINCQKILAFEEENFLFKALLGLRIKMVFWKIFSKSKYAEISKTEKEIQNALNIISLHKNKYIVQPNCSLVLKINDRPKGKLLLSTFLQVNPIDTTNLQQRDKGNQPKDITDSVAEEKGITREKAEEWI